MKLKFVYKVFPVLLVTNDLLVPFGYDAYNYFFFIAFRNKKYLEDNALVLHELEHTKQAIKLPVLHSFLYRFSKKYRYKSELDAYVKQLQFYSKDEQIRLVSSFTDMLYKHYNLSGYKDYFDIKTDLVQRLGLSNA